MMPVIAPSLRLRERKRIQRRYPVRTLHLIDIENLVGSAVPSLAQVQQLRTQYCTRLNPGAADHIVLACNHRAFRTAGFGWLDSRHMVRSGRDGADLELLDVMHNENVAQRFARVAIASGDGAFADEATRLSKLGCELIVISRRDALSARLALAAHQVVYLDDAGQASTMLVPSHRAALPDRRPRAGHAHLRQMPASRTASRSAGSLPRPARRCGRHLP